MIFNNEEVTTLVKSWKSDPSVETLEAILVKSNSLIEVIVSQYPNFYRDDLIQEARVRLHYSLQFYDPRLSLHNYFTSVIHNICRTFISKQNRFLSCIDDDYEVIYEEGESVSSIPQEELLADIITRNRKRFQSIPTDIIDDITEFIITSLQDANKPRGITAAIVSNFNISRSIANLIYQSTLVYLRGKYEDFAEDNDGESLEFTLLPDIREEIGAIAYERMKLLFSGMYIRVP